MVKTLYLLVLFVGLALVSSVVIWIIAALTSSNNHPDFLEDIQWIGTDAQRRARELSDDFLRSVSELLKERRR